MKRLISIVIIGLFPMLVMAQNSSFSIKPSMKGFAIAFSNLPTTASLAAIHLDCGTSTTVVFHGSAGGGEAAGFGKRFGLATEDHFVRLAVGDGKTTETFKYGPVQCPDFLLLGGETFPDAATIEAQRTAKAMGVGAEEKGINRAAILNCIREALKRAANAQRDANKAQKAAEAAAQEAAEEAAKY